ncbi:MAG: Holliday junction branch migration protein RuvA [Clostridia bacterium]|nr:Holliday junction branch migration protein RuvA [Clostridia bacterium]
MIYTLYGTVFEVDQIGGFAVIDCGGVGYKLTASANTLAALPAPAFTPSGDVRRDAEPVRVYTHLAVREDDVELFGFISREELEAFKMLISVSGVGPKAAMAILSLFTPDALFSAIIAEDTKGISRASGVGGKTAARVVLELRDKVAKAYGRTGEIPGPKSTGEISAPGGGKFADARDALLVLGYSRTEVMNALKGVDPSKPTEAIIKDALAVLMKQ